jgi:DNA-binding transcriptional ArsR family regulator
MTVPSLPEVLALGAPIAGFAALVPLAMRLDDEDFDPLEAPQRKAMMDVIKARPGISVGDLKEEMPFGWASLYYHLGILIDAGLVKDVLDEIDGRRRHLYPILKGGKIPKPKTPEPVLSEPSTEVSMAIINKPGMNLQELIEELGMTPRNVYYHVRRLEEAGLIKSSSRTRYRDLTARPALYELLGLPKPKGLTKGARR